MAGKKSKRQKNQPPKTNSGTGLVLGLVVVIAVVVIAALAKDPGNGPPQTAEASSNRSSSEPAGGPSNLPPPPRTFPENEIRNAQRITVEEAKNLIDQGQAVVIDVRSVEDFASGHIPGSLQIPLGFVEGEIPWFPVDKKLITLCT